MKEARKPLFSGAGASAGHLIGIISRRSQCYFDQQFSQIALSSGTFFVLLVLANHSDISQNELSRLLSLDKANIARGTKKLIEQGYVKRIVDRSDKRAYKLNLTEKGKELLPKIRLIIGLWNDILTTGFSEQEKKIVIELLNRMSMNAKTCWNDHIIE